MTCFYCADGSEKRNIFKTSVQTWPPLPPLPQVEWSFILSQVCDCHEFTSPESCPGAIPLASAGRDGSPARCGSARVRSRCHQRGDPPSLALKGPRRREAAGWGLRSPGRSRSSPARNLLGERLLSSGSGDKGPPHASSRASLPDSVPRRGAGCSGLGSTGSLSNPNATHT